MTKGARTAYARGRAFELRVRKYLEKLGWLVVRSPMSRGPFDLIAISAGQVLLLQCKGGRAMMPPKEWNKLIDVGEKTSATCLLVSREKRKLKFYRLLGRKTARGRQPMVAVSIGEAGRRVGARMDEPRHYAIA